MSDYLLGPYMPSCRHLAFALVMQSSSLNDAAMLKLLVDPSKREDLALRRMGSSIDYALSKYRQQLTTAMTGLDGKGLGLALSGSNALERLQPILEKFRSVVKGLPEKWEANEQILRDILSTMHLEQLLVYSGAEIAVDEEGLSSLPQSPKQTLYKADSSKPSSYESLEQVLFHIQRDWGDMPSARNVRDSLYRDGVLKLALRYLSHSGGVCAKVLVPGAGLGRLAVELAAQGLQVETNEVSNIMVAALTGVVRKLSDIQQVQGQGQGYVFYPYLSSPMMDEWEYDSRMREVRFPGEDASHLVEWLVRGDGYPITLQMGDFHNIYSHPKYMESFDCVITSFFVDCSLDILRTVALISHILIPGGVWINAGPLHYHSNDTVSPFSHDLLQEVIRAGGFSVEHEERIGPLSYSGEEMYSMKPEVYIVPLSAYRLVDTDRRFPVVFESGNHSSGISPRDGQPNFILR